jgi:hypothetical protein
MGRCWQSVWVYGHSTVRRHQTSYLAASYLPPMRHGARPPLLRPHPPRGPRPSRRRHGSSICLSSATGNFDGSLSEALRSSQFSPTHPFTLQLLLGSAGFRRGDTVLVSSRSSCSEINGGRLGDSGDNEDHSRRRIVSEEPHRRFTCMKSSRALVGACFSFIESASVSLTSMSFFGFPFLFPSLMEWSGVSQPYPSTVK